VIGRDTLIDISHEALIRCWQKIADKERGWLQREFEDGLTWQSLRVQARRFLVDPEQVLSTAATSYTDAWLHTLPSEAWSERYHGGWADVHRLIDASRNAAYLTPTDVLKIYVRNADALDDQWGFPFDTQIRRGSGALRLFELAERDYSWLEFQDRLEPEFRESLHQSFWPAIYSACVKSIKSRRLLSTHTVMRSPADGRHYMPMISRVETSGDHSATFHITFVHVAAGTRSEVRAKSVSRIFAALNLAHRFRWEIIDPYRDLDRLQRFVDHHRERSRDPSANRAGAGTGSGGLAVIWEAIRLIETESINRGVYDEEALPRDFGPGAEGRVRAMFPMWQEKRQQLEQAVPVGDVATFARVLAELDPLNVEFISLASQRLGDLVRADASTAEAAIL
jgi:hypothetical protein